MTTLTQPTVSLLLDRLFAEADASENLRRRERTTLSPEQRTADRDGESVAEERHAEYGADHFGGVGFIDGVEEDALQIVGDVGAQRRGDPRGEQR